MEWVERYVIYVISEDGLLKHPKDSMNDTIFSIYGYEDEWEARGVIERRNFTRDCVILKVLSGRVTSY